MRTIVLATACMLGCSGAVQAGAYSVSTGWRSIEYNSSDSLPLEFAFPGFDASLGVLQEAVVNFSGQSIAVGFDTGFVTGDPAKFTSYFAIIFDFLQPIRTSPIVTQGTAIGENVAANPVNFSYNFPLGAYGAAISGYIVPGVNSNLDNIGGDIELGDDLSFSITETFIYGVPEPTSLAILAAALGVLGAAVRLAQAATERRLRALS